MPRKTVDLIRRIGTDDTGIRAADFPVSLKPVLYRKNGSYVKIPNRKAVVREDTGRPLAVVSDRYTLVPHGRLLELALRATLELDTGPVPRGIYLDRNGARLRAIFKFPGLARPVQGEDEICPCIKIQNTYDGTSRIAVHIGAFRFVCTNLAVGGGGVFAGGFMAVHSGEIPIDEIAERFGAYLSGFGEIVGTYRAWRKTPLERDRFFPILEPLPKRTAEGIRARAESIRTVYGAYNAATWFATHRMRSYQTAFQLLRHINQGFQEAFPISAS